MKRILLLCIIGIGFFTFGANKLIKFPEYIHSEETTIGIDSVELNDKATLFDVSLYHHHGYWVRLNPKTKLIGRATGKEYAIKSVSGLELGEKTYVPFSGYISSKIYFDPLEPSDSIVDFIEPNGWKIYGIKLYDTTDGRIKTNLSGTVNSDRIARLFIIQEADDITINKVNILPVRNGSFNYNLITDSPANFIIFEGIDSPEMIAHPKRFIAKGDSLTINFEYEEEDLF